MKHRSTGWREGSEHKAPVLSETVLKLLSNWYHVRLGFYLHSEVPQETGTYIGIVKVPLLFVFICLLLNSMVIVEFVLQFCLNLWN